VVALEAVFATTRSWGADASRARGAGLASPDSASTTTTANCRNMAILPAREIADFGSLDLSLTVVKVRRALLPSFLNDRTFRHL